MSSLIDKIRTMINAQLRGPRRPRSTQPPTDQPPAAPPTSERIPEVTEGRPRKLRAEVSETTPEPPRHEATPQAPAPPARRPDAQTTPPDHDSGLDEGRVADMLKRNRPK